MVRSVTVFAEKYPRNCYDEHSNAKHQIIISPSIEFSAFLDSSNANHLSNGDVTLTLPDWTDSSVNDGYVLTTDGSQHATLSWSAPASGGASALNDLSDVTYSNGDLAITNLDTLNFSNGGNANVSVLATAHGVAGKELTIAAGSTTAATTNNIAGGNITIQGGQGKGTGAGGNIIFQVAPAAAGSGSTLNSYISPLTIASTGITTALHIYTAYLKATTNIRLSTDGSSINFGASGDGEITLTHVHDVGLTLTNTMGSGPLPVVFRLKSEEDEILADEVISLNFLLNNSIASSLTKLLNFCEFFIKFIISKQLNN